MKTAFALLIVCFATLAVGVGVSLIDSATKPESMQMHMVKQPPAYTLNIERAFDFLKKHLPEALEKAPPGSIACDALDGHSVVSIRRGDSFVDMAVELITGNEMDDNEYFIRLCGMPATLDDTYALALRLCELAKLPNDRIVAWYKEKGYESPLDSAEAQIGREGERQHSVNVRSSLELEGDKQWRVVYTIFFPGPDGESRKDPSANVQVRMVEQPPAYTLNVERASDFLKKHLPEALEKAPPGSIAHDAIDGNSVVCIRRGDSSVDMEVESITADELPG